MELLAWAQAQSIALPTSSYAKPKECRLTRADLQLPETLATEHVRAAASTRSPGGGAVSIESVLITAERDAFRALGLAFFAYALSDQAQAFRLKFAFEGAELAQL